MSRVQQIITLIVASICLSLGISIIIIGGLPERASYTGQILKDIGYVAPEINHRAPPFTLTNLQFENTKLDNTNQQVTILNFWATWCVPCRIEMQELQALHEVYQNDIQILGINLGESPQLVAQWVDDYALTYEILLDPLQSVAQLYQIRGQPSTYIIDSDNIIRMIHYGPVNMAQLEREINSIVNPTER